MRDEPSFKYVREVKPLCQLNIFLKLYVEFFIKISKKFSFSFDLLYVFQTWLK